MYRLFRMSGILMLSLIVLSCGQKGALVLPQQQTDSQPPQAGDRPVDASHDAQTNDEETAK